MQRMITAGAEPMTWMVVHAERQRDRARTEHLEEGAAVPIEHGGGTGIALFWEMQLLDLRHEPA